MRGARRLWVGIPGPTLDDATRAHLLALRPGGVVLFRRNVGGLAETRRLVVDLRALLGPDLHVAVDQEHGLVVRFDRELTVFPGAMALGATGVRETSFAEHLAEDCGRRAAEELTALGIDVNFGPVCDLAVRGDNPGLGVRSFGSYPGLAGKLVAAWTRGADAAGVASTLKHFPGLGGAESDSHDDLPRAALGVLDDLLTPFAAGIAADAACVMSTHCAFPELDGDVPATFSATIQRGLLRERLGFRGVLVTDDLEMGAMTKRFGFDEVARRAAAVHDVLIVCHDAAKQRRAAEILAAEFPPDDATTARLDALLRRTAPARRGAAVDALATRVRTPAALRLAAAVAGRAVTVVRDPASLLPLSADEPVALLVPPLGDVTGVEDPLRGETLDTLRAGLPPGSTIFAVPRLPTADDAERLLAAAAPFRRAILGTTLARFRPAEAAFLRAFATRHAGPVVVALRNPFDFEVAPADGPAAWVTAFGFRPVHQAALLEVLFGRVAPYGRLPVVLVLAG